MITTEQQQNLFILLTGHLSKYEDLKQKYHRIFSSKPSLNPSFEEVLEDLKVNGYLNEFHEGTSSQLLINITPEGETLADSLLSKASEPILKELQEGPKDYSYLVSLQIYPLPMLELLVDTLIDHDQINSTSLKEYPNDLVLSIPGNEPKMIEDTSKQADPVETPKEFQADQEANNKPAETKEIPIELYYLLEYLGLLPNSVRDHNIGESDYSKHFIQPWTIWLCYTLNPWDADIVKRVLRDKSTEPRIQDYEKIIHNAQERIRQIQTKKKLK